MAVLILHYSRISKNRAHSLFYPKKEIFHLLWIDVVIFHFKNSIPCFDLAVSFSLKLHPTCSASFCRLPPSFIRTDLIFIPWDSHCIVSLPTFIFRYPDYRCAITSASAAALWVCAWVSSLLIRRLLQPPPLSQWPVLTRH